MQGKVNQTILASSIMPIPCCSSLVSVLALFVIITGITNRRPSSQNLSEAHRSANDLSLHGNSSQRQK